MFASPIGTATPNTVYAQQSTSPIGAATPNTVYTQHGAKPACQEAIHTKCSHLLLTQHLLLVQLPRTQFTHSASTSPIDAATPNTVYTRQPACQEAINAKFSISYWHSYSEHSLHTAERQTRMLGSHRRKMFASPSTAPATQTGAAAHGDQARRNPFWKLQVLRLPHRQEPRPTPHRQEPRPTATRHAATLSGGSKYCACHTDRSNPFWKLQVLRLPHRKERGPRRPGAPQPFLEAPSTAPATQTGAAAHGDQARRNPF